MISLGVLFSLTLASVFASHLTPYSPTQRNLPEQFLSPSPGHWLGTDHLGRDVLTRLLYGEYLSLSIGSISVALSVTIGLLLGLIAGYLGGRTDWVIMRMIDLILAFPGIIFALWLVYMLGPGLYQVILANALFGLPVFTRVVRGQVLSLKETDYIAAARALGANRWRIIIRHLLPNLLASVLVLGSLSISSAILSSAGLSYLGLGVQPPTPEWGAMLADGRPFLRSAWWLTLFPGLGLFLIALACNIIGDGLRDAFDPHGPIL